MIVSIRYKEYGGQEYEFVDNVDPNVDGGWVALYHEDGSLTLVNKQEVSWIKLSSEYDDDDGDDEIVEN